jgi:hypothetical protein
MADAAPITFTDAWAQPTPNATAYASADAITNFSTDLPAHNKSDARADATALCGPDASSFAGARQSDAAAVAQAYAEPFPGADADADDAGADANPNDRPDYIIGDAPEYHRRRLQCRQGRHASGVCAFDY